MMSDRSTVRFSKPTVCSYAWPPSMSESSMRSELASPSTLTVPVTLLLRITTLEVLTMIEQPTSLEPMTVPDFVIVQEPLYGERLTPAGTPAEVRPGNRDAAFTWAAGLLAGGAGLELGGLLALALTDGTGTLGTADDGAPGAGRDGVSLPAAVVSVRSGRCRAYTVTAPTTIRAVSAIMTYLIRRLGRRRLPGTS